MSLVLCNSRENCVEDNMLSWAKAATYAPILERIHSKKHNFPRLWWHHHVTLLSPLSPLKKGANALYIVVLTPCHPFFKKFLDSSFFVIRCTHKNPLTRIANASIQCGRITNPTEQTSSAQHGKYIEGINESTINSLINMDDSFGGFFKWITCIDIGI